MPRKLPIFYSALMLTGVNLLLRFVGTSFQVYLSSRIGAAGIGLLQLVMSVGGLSMVAGMGGIRTATMYLTAEELGRKRPQNVVWVLSGFFLYSICFSGCVASALYHFAPWIASVWIGDPRTVDALRLFASFLPVTCLCGVMTGYFTAANRIGTLAAVEVAEQFCSMALTLGGLTLLAGNDSVRSTMCVILGSSAGYVLTLVCLIVLRLREHAPCGPRITVRSRLAQAALPLAIADDLKSGISTVELARCAAAGSQKRIHYLVCTTLRVALVYGALTGGLLSLLSDSLCISLYNSLDASKPMRAYALLVPMLYSDIVTDAMTKGLGQQKVCVRYNIFTSLLDVLFLYFLLPRYGMVGYFISFLVAHLINFLLSLRRLLQITIRSIPAHIPLLAGSSIIFSVWAAGFVSNVPLRCATYILLLGSVFVLLGILRKEDIQWAKGLIYKK